MDNIILKEDKKLDMTIAPNEVHFVVEEDKEIFLSLTNLSLNNNVLIELNKGSIVHLSVLANKEYGNMKICANLALNSKIIAYFADFSKDNNNLDVTINLNEKNASAEWHLASLASSQDKKDISVSVFHNSEETFAKVDNYGVSKDNSKLVFAGTSHILKGSIKSKTHQNAKIMVFDPYSDATAKPILKIDENDIEASHAAAVGKISDEHLFYLTSRGLSMDEAKMIITLGYLKPIFKGFNDEEVNEMNEIIEGRL